MYYFKCNIFERVLSGCVLTPVKENDVSFLYHITNNYINITK